MKHFSEILNSSKGTATVHFKNRPFKDCILLRYKGFMWFEHGIMFNLSDRNRSVYVTYSEISIIDFDEGEDYNAQT